MTGYRSSPFTSMRVARPRRGRRVVKIVAGVVLLMTVLAFGTAIYLWRYANSQIDRVDLSALDPEVSEESGEPIEDPVPGTVNVLVVGTDSREGLTDEQLQELGTEDIGTQLTDTIMLVQLSPVRDRAVVLSFPRDLKVDVPGSGSEKINAVHGIGGANLLVDVVERYTGVQIDNYVEVSIAGFLDLTDAIGGVEVCLDAPMEDRYAGVDLPAGCQMLDGRQAAGFVRSRRVEDQFGADNDFGRIARQQYFIRQAMDRVTSAGTLLNPVKVKRLVDAVAGAVVTDEDLGVRRMLQLANGLKSLGPDDIVTRTIPGYWSEQTGYVHAYPEQAEALLQALRQGEPLPEFGSEAPADLAPGDVSVQVLNGAGVDGLGAHTEQFLREREFRVVDVGNAASFDIEVSVLRHTEQTLAHAQLLADYLPGVELEQVARLPAGVDVAFVVGADRAS